MPQLMAAVGMTGGADTLAGFVSAYLYGMILLVFPMVFLMLRVHEMFTRQIDRGGIACLLAAPVPRPVIARTQLLALHSATGLLCLFCTGLELLVCQMLWPGELDTAGLLRMNLGLLTLHLALGSFCYLAAVACADTRWATALSAGVPSVMMLLQMLSNLGGRLEPLRYGTIFTLFSPDDLLAGSGWGGVVALAALALGLSAAAVAVFSRRGLHL